MTGAAQTTVLLNAQSEALIPWVSGRGSSQVFYCLAAIAAGAGFFGAAIGLWRSPLQALYTGVKFPLVVCLISLGNGLLNGMLAPLLGVNIGWRQSSMAILMSFAIAALILGAFSPIILFLVWNLPPLDRASTAYSFLLVTAVAVIALAGIAANLRLLRLLEAIGGSAPASRKVLVAWLAGSLLLGTQLCWILRPFVGSPALPVQFLREDAFSGSFFETFLRAFANLFGS